MKKSNILLLTTAITWTGATVCAAISPENYLYIMIIAGLLILSSIKKLGDS